MTLEEFKKCATVYIDLRDKRKRMYHYNETAFRNDVGFYELRNPYKLSFLYKKLVEKKIK